MIIRTVYKTVDGEIFENENSAIEHENELSRKAEKDIMIQCVKTIKEHCNCDCNSCPISLFCSKEFFGMPADWDMRDIEN